MLGNGREGAGKAGLQVEVRSVDLTRDPKSRRRTSWRTSLSFCFAQKPRRGTGTLDMQVRRESGTFSAARWKHRRAWTAPCKSKTEIYRLASNDSKLQRQADEGTLLATRICEDVPQTRKADQTRRLLEVQAFVKDLSPPDNRQ